MPSRPALGLVLLGSALSAGCLCPPRYDAPAARIYNPHGEAKAFAKVNYDKFNNVTMVFVSEVQLTGGIGNGISFNPFFLSQGPTAVHPRVVYLTFWSYSQSPAGTIRYLFTDPEIIFIADGERIRASAAETSRKAEPLMEYHRPTGAVLVTENLTFAFRAEQFAQLANARSIEARIAGSVEVVFQPIHLEALRAIVAAMPPEDGTVTATREKVSSALEQAFDVTHEQVAGLGSRKPGGLVCNTTRTTCTVEMPNSQSFDECRAGAMLATLWTLWDLGDEAWTKAVQTVKVAGPGYHTDVAVRERSPEAYTFEITTTPDGVTTPLYKKLVRVLRSPL